MATVKEKKPFKNLKKKEDDKENKKIQISKINEIIDSCKDDWEIARLKKCDREKRQEAIGKIFAKIKGNVAAMLKKRTGSRLLQTIFKFTDEKTKDEIFNEIKSEITMLANCSFGIFFLQKLLKTKYFFEIVDVLAKNHKKLIADRVGAFFLDEVYQTLKKGPQKDFLKRLMGNKAQVFYSKTKLMDIPPKEFDFESIIRKMLDKGLTNLTIGHDLINLHISHFEKEEDKKIYVKGLLEFFVDFLHTINGRKIVNMILEDKTNLKSVIKQVGDHLTSLISSEDSRTVLFSIIEKSEAEEDEKLKETLVKDVTKYIFKPIKENIETFLNTENFDLFVVKLIELKKFEYLQSKFIKEIQKKDSDYSESLQKLAADLQK
ncbi:Puf family RNA-binding protein [Pseudoloma neurophilia]|uniref:Puf family RNA-binding protein n=1 Tax=Pseudoloma neurophilia TaxID=146866 RepID=A0A0R0M105_9MICR|nr:Puf family RNA-binding protein [Pseudoloma neurophilia]